MMEGSTSEERQARGARTQSLMREVNERVKEINQAFSHLVPMGDWICECADDSCAERILLTPTEYEAVRADPKRFAVAPGAHHFVPEIERLVEQRDRYWVVEKFGVAGEIATQVDPRRDGLRSSVVKPC
jgi:hypothetical protein